MKLSNDPNEDKARKATALGLLLLGVLGSQRDPRTFTVGSRLESLAEQATTPAPGGITGGRGGRPIPGLIGLQNRALPGGIGRGGRQGTFLMPLAMNNQGGSWHVPPSYINQILIGGSTDITHNANTEENSIWGGHSWSAAAYNRAQIMPTGGELSVLDVKLSNAPGAGNNYKFNVLVNGVASALTVTISNAETRGTDTTHQVTVSPFDIIQIQSVPTSSPSTTMARYSVNFVSSVAQEIVMLADCGPSTGSPTWNPMQQGGAGSSGTEAYTHAPMPCDGTFRTMRAMMTNAPGAGKSMTFTLRVNGGDTALECVIQNAMTQNSDISSDVHVSRGDMVNWQATPAGTPAYPGVCYVSCVFVPDTADQQVLLGVAGDGLASAATEYNKLTDGMVNCTWSGTDNRFQGVRTMDMHDLIVVLTAAPGVGKTRSFTLMVNGAPSALVATVSGTDTEGEDITNTVTLTDDDIVSIKTIPSGSPALARAAWGVAIN